MPRDAQSLPCRELPPLTAQEVAHLELYLDLGPAHLSTESARRLMATLRQRERENAAAWAMLAADLDAGRSP